MKFLAALLASAAAATAKVGCDVKISYYISTDTDCSKTATDDAIKAIVGTCQFSVKKEKWYKLTKCTTYQVTMEWYGDDDTCATAPTKLDKVTYTSTGVCTKAALTSTDTAEFYTLTAKAASMDTSKLCSFAFIAYDAASAACTGDANAANLKIVTDFGFGATRIPYIVN